MMSIQTITDYSAVLVLLSTFLMISKVRLVPMLRYFAFMSLFLSAMGAAVGYIRGEELFYLTPIVTIFFKVILIPLILYFTAKKLPSSNQLRMYFRPATTYFMFLGILFLSFVVVRDMPVNIPQAGDKLVFFQGLLFISMALIMTGILLMLARKDLFSQILGLLTMENGITAFGLVELGEFPLFLEMGIFMVIIASAIILAVLAEKVHKEYVVGDTSKLNELID